MMQNASHGQHLPRASYTVLLMKEFVTNCSQEMFVMIHMITFFESMAETNSVCNGLKKENYFDRHL